MKIRKLFSTHDFRRDMQFVIHLPLVERLTHSFTHKIMRTQFWNTLRALTLGAIVIILGAYIAHEKQYLIHLIIKDEKRAENSVFLVDALGYFIHAVGASPILFHARSWLMLIFGAAE